MDTRISSSYVGSFAYVSFTLRIIELVKHLSSIIGYQNYAQACISFEYMQKKSATDKIICKHQSPIVGKPSLSVRANQNLRVRILNFTKGLHSARSACFCRTSERDLMKYNRGPDSLLKQKL